MSDVYLQRLDENNVKDAQRSVAEPGWMGVVSEEHGGIIAYVHVDNAPALSAVSHDE